MTKTQYNTDALKVVRPGRKPSAKLIAERMGVKGSEVSESTVKKYFQGVRRVTEDHRAAFEAALGQRVNWVAYDRATGVMSPGVRAEDARQAMAGMVQVGAFTYGLLRDAARDLRAAWEDRKARRAVDVTPAAASTGQAPVLLTHQSGAIEGWAEDQPPVDWGGLVRLGLLVAGGAVLLNTLAKE